MAPTQTNASRTGPWKNGYNFTTVRQIGESFRAVYRQFDVDRFVAAINDAGLFDYELKARISLVTGTLRDFLPDDYARATTLLRRVAPGLNEFQNWTLTAFVEQCGLHDFDLSLATLKELTKYGTGEFAIRPFIMHDPEKVLAVMHAWAVDPNEHVRRLAAEGSRPLGVWVAYIEAFKKHPQPVLRLLEKLKADSSPYVRKAVANNLSDIAKNHPDLVIKTARRWQSDGSKNTNRIIKHACRGLIKNRDPRVFPLLGFTEKPQISVSPLRLSEGEIPIGGTLTFAFQVLSRSTREQRLAIDYVIHFARTNGRNPSKVFKLTEKTLPAGEIVSISKEHSFVDRSTRKHRPGRHEIELVINGETARKKSFLLIAAA